MFRAIVKTAAALTALLAQPVANAADGAHSFEWGVGLGALVQQQPYAGIDRETLPVPLIYFENKWVQLLGPRLDLKLPSVRWNADNELSYGVGVQLYGFGGYEPDDAPILNGMQERKESLFAGPYVKWRNPVATVAAEWFHDASSESQGQRMSLGLEHTFTVVGERLSLTPRVAAVWMDEKFVNYYFGVRTNEVRDGRPAYVGGSTLNTDMSLRADYKIDSKQTVIALVGDSLLGDEIKDSPLTDRSSETFSFMGYLYRF